MLRLAVRAASGAVAGAAMLNLSRATCEPSPSERARQTRRRIAPPRAADAARTCNSHSRAAASRCALSCRPPTCSPLLPALFRHHPRVTTTPTPRAAPSAGACCCSAPASAAPSVSFSCRAPPTAARRRRARIRGGDGDARRRRRGGAGRRARGGAADARASPDDLLARLEERLRAARSARATTGRRGREAAAPVARQPSGSRRWACACTAPAGAAPPTATTAGGRRSRAATASAPSWRRAWCCRCKTRRCTAR